MDAVDSLTWTHLTPDATGAWSELTTLLAERDGTGESYSADDLAEELGEHGFTPELDSWAVWDGGALVAFGQLRVGLTLDAEGRVRGIPAQWSPAGWCMGPGERVATEWVTVTA